MSSTKIIHMDNRLKKLLIACLLIIYFVCPAQVFYSPYTGNLRYMGDMNEKVLSYLDSSEINMYYECLEMLELNKDSVMWLKGEYYHLVFHNEKKYTVQYAVREKENNRYKTSTFVQERSGELPSPMCLVFINRQDGNFRISVQKYK